MNELVRVRNRTAVAYGRSADTCAAVAECTKQLRNMEPQLLLVFCGGKHDPTRVLEAITRDLPDIPVVGGAAAGAITRGGSGCSGLEIGMMAFLDPATTPIVIEGRTFARGEERAGADLGRKIAEIASDSALVLLFYDSVATQSPLSLHPAAAIVKGIRRGLGNKRITLIGGGMLTDMNMSGGWIFAGADAIQHGLVALVFPRNVKADTVILHGCRPVSSFMEITRIDGAVVYELDGKPALGVIEGMLGIPIGGSNPSDLLLVATLGIKQGDPFAPFDESQYVNRLILGTDRQAGSITLFEPDLSLGDQVQIMSRDNELMLQSVLDGVSVLNNAEYKDSDEMLACLYIDCAGRASVRSGARVEEADIVRRQINPDIPFLGFYSGVEIAPFKNAPRALDWSGVLTVLRICHG